MKVSELKKIIEGLPDNVTIMVGEEGKASTINEDDIVLLLRSHRTFIQDKARKSKK